MPELLGFEARAGEQFEGETLFLRGSQSDYVGEQHRPAIRALFPGAEVRSIAGAGHWVHAEQPGAFLAAARAFLSCPGE